MTAFKAAHSVAEEWAPAAKACIDALAGAPQGANLGFVYATDNLAENFSSILAYLRQKTGIEHWVGSVGLGVCAGGEEFFDQSVLAVMAASLPDDAFCIFPTISEGVEQLSPAIKEWIAGALPLFGIVHGDPNNDNTPGLIEDLAALTSGFLVGGLTSSRTACHQVAGRITGGGLSGVLFSPDLKVATGLSQGCAPIAGSHIISDCLDNVIIGLDGRKAFDVLKEDVGEPLSRDLNKIAGHIHAALPIEGSDTGDYLVRNLIGIDATRGWLAIGEEIYPGERVMFVRRDPQSAKADLVDMLRKLKKRVGEAPRGGIYFSGVARGPDMFGTDGGEMALIRDILGPVPVVGFYANGEISNNRLYGYTGVLVLFL
ncbi:MAG TPA: FIST C-terminal domain-containing protein [Rhodospirillales bacterium]|jgi:small ligand-binding sensory domain FIST|nr:FIST C-terminal domain-containing protein [Rhodospirillales bacterium]